MAREMVCGRLGMSVLVLALGGYGCGGTTNTTHESTQDGGVDGGGSLDTDAAAAACRHYFSALHELGCGGPGLPASEKLRLETRGVQVCLDQMALPGSGMNTNTVEACAEALAASPCQLNDGPPAECRFQGTLPGGAVCNDPMQCQSGRCAGTAILTPGGQQGPSTCGKCAPVAALGEVCGQGDVSAGCAGNAACAIEVEMRDASMATYSCVAIAAGDIGDACDGLTATCKTGLYCAAQTAQCVVLGNAGDECGEGPGSPGVPGGCGKPLSCVGLPGMAKCSAGAPGALCLNDFDCPSGSGCIPGPCSTTVARIGCAASGTCGPVQWASPGEACDPFATRCLVGSCEQRQGVTAPPLVPSADGGPAMGTCPIIAADGQP